MPYPKVSYYAVKKGRIPGIYSSWAQCAMQVNGFSNAVYQKFSSIDEAEKFVTTPNHQADEVDLASLSISSQLGASKKIIIVDSGEWDTVYCEAHQCEDGNVGLGVWWSENHCKNLSERCPGLESLERGEMVAVVRALENFPAGNSSLLVKTTSLRCIYHIQICVQIMKAEGQAEGISLQDMPLSIYIPRLLARVRRQGHRIRFQHVDEHRNVQEHGKEQAKGLAMRGVQKEAKKRVWALRDIRDADDKTHSVQTSLACLEIEVSSYCKGTVDII